jgi:hypothetical protein
MRERVKFITHRGKQILSIDLAQASPEEFLATMEHARGIIARQPLSSLRTLTNVTGIRYRTEIGPAVRDFVEHNKPYVVAGAVVGLDALKTIMFNFINRVTGRSLRAMDSAREAMDWLAGQ